MTRYSLRYITMLAAIISVAATMGSMIKIISPDNRWVMMTMTAVLAIMISAFLSFFLRTLQKNPTPLRIGLVGLPGSGKTVYLSVLFHEIQAREDDAISFQPYGAETVEAVTRNINSLTRGEWLPSTDRGSVFPFRANARVAGGFLPRRYTVEIGDYAGEHMKELDPTTEEWLHRTKYFEYLTGADVLLLAIDGERLVRDEPSRSEQMLNHIIASFQVLLDAKGLQPGRRTEMPVAILVLKADLITSKEGTIDDVVRRLARLSSLCGNRCQRSKIFFVSAVGHVGENGAPPSELRPEHVCDPVIWALRSVTL
jgi:GTPase SAR1 family protein